VDYRWVRHLTDLDRLREGIGLRAFAQVDPLVAYKQEAFRMYLELMSDIRSDIVKSVFSVQVRAEPQVAAPIARNIRTNRGAGSSNGGGRPAPARRETTLGRNDMCWCGSGKKYKHCHMRTDAKQGAKPAKVPAKN
jgi:preprotein translocase subunit SecA